MKYKLIMENWRRFINEEVQDDSWKYYGDKGRSDTQLKVDRDWKREWNSKADHDFFKNEVKKVHWIGGVHKTHSPAAQEAQLIGDLKSWGNITSIHKDELSCIGYLDLPIQDGLGMALGLLVDGYTSYAAASDIQTEWTSAAEEEDIERYGSSGLPKRANIKDKAMYNKETFVEPMQSSGGYNELIVDNWKAVGVILKVNHRYFKWMYKNMNSEKYKNIKALRKKEIKDILAYCRSIGVPLLDINLNPIEKKHK